jgi:hypothetical protein
MATRRGTSGEGRIAAEMAALNRAQRGTAPSAGVAPSASGGLSWTPAGGGQFVGAGPSNVPGGTSQPGAPAPAAAPTPAAEPPRGPSGPAAPAGPSPDDIQAMIDAALAREREARLTQDRADASAFLRDILTQYGMGDLAGSVDQLVKDWGTSQNVIANKLRETESYKSRFKGLLGLQQRGITDVANEAEYINLESQYRQVFRDNGVQNFLGDAGSKAEQDAIAKLVGDYSVSVNEVRDRVVDAQRVVADTPQEVRDSLQRYYNVDPATLTAYVLDPTRTSTRINQLANAAIIGGYGTRAGLQFGTQAAERIGEFLSGGENLRGSQIEPQLTEIADVQRATERLAQIEKSELSAEETALSQLNLDVTARQKVKALQSRERARFGGSSAITQGTLGRSQNI